jgi:hypothetical protein
MINFNKIFNYLNIICLILFVISCFVFTWNSILLEILGTIYFIVFYFFVKYSRDNNILSPLIKTSYLSLFFFFNLRLIVLIYFPESFIRVSDFSITFLTFERDNLLNVILILLFFSFIIFLFSLSFNNYKQISLNGFRNLNHVTKNIYFIVILLLLFVRFFFQVQFGWLHGSGPYKFGWLSNFMPFGILITITYLIFFDDKNFKKHFYFLNLLFLISSILIGSRSILFSLFFHLFFVTFLFQKNFIISKSKYLVYFLVVFSLVLGVWTVSNFTRGSSVENSSILITFLSIFSRLGAPFDGLYLILNSSSYESQEVFKIFWDFKIIFANIINSIFPGDLVKIAGPTAGELFKVIYFNESLDFAMGDVWSGPGYLFAGFLFFSPFIYFLFLLSLCAIIFLKTRLFFTTFLKISLIYHASVSFFAIGMLENFLTDYLLVLIQSSFFFILIFLLKITVFWKR